MWLLTTSADEPAKLIHKQEKDLEPHSRTKAPAKIQYAILSHRWEADSEEVTFDDLRSGDYRKDKTGCFKLSMAQWQARQDGFDYVWIDTCCIDKRSNTELQESINSMYHWYERAAVCYAYLRDTEKNKLSTTFKQDSWFTRGWTLQELIAPKHIRFFDRSWRYIGSKRSLCNDIRRITRIPEGVLAGKTHCRDYSVAQRMSWASGRETARVEDEAYCLLGIFGINIPMLYGERQGAFLRLQEAIMSSSTDQSIFAWESPTMLDETGIPVMPSMLATSALYFKNSRHIKASKDPRSVRPFSITNVGLLLTCELRPWTVNTYMATLGATCRGSSVCIFLRQLVPESDLYVRVQMNGCQLWIGHLDEFLLEKELRVRRNPPHNVIEDREAVRLDHVEMVTVLHSQSSSAQFGPLQEWIYGFHLSGELFQHGSNGHCEMSFPLQDGFAGKLETGMLRACATFDRNHSWNPSTNVLSIPVGTPYPYMPEVEFKNSQGVRVRLKLGFDHFFNPTVFISTMSGDSVFLYDDPESIWQGTLDVRKTVQSKAGVPSETTGVQWHIQDGCATEPNASHPDIWLLKGDKVTGLDIEVRPEEFDTNEEWTTIVLRVVEFEGQLVWDLHMNRLPVSIISIGPPWVRLHRYIHRLLS